MSVHSLETETLEDRGRETRRRLLDAAEVIFAERGYSGASMRAITQAAGASVSAANYHFGCKQTLLRETIMRRVGPVNERRLAELSRLESQAGEGPAPSVEAVVECFLRPALEELFDGERNTMPLRQVAARIHSDPPEVVHSVLPEVFGEVTERFCAALGKALPEVSVAVIGEAFSFTIGVLVHIIGGHTEVTEAILGVSPNSSKASLEERISRVTAFLAAGVRAAAQRPPVGEAD